MATKIKPSNLDFTTLNIAVSNTGNVGIGTSSPGGNLHIQGEVGNQVRLYLTDGDATGVGNSLLIGKSGLSSFVSDRQSGSSLWFGTADTERMRITSLGNVGIGTSSPTGNLTIGGSSPRLDFLETGGSAGFDNTILIRDADVFSIQTRNGATFVSNDYRMSANASGALTHEWRIGNTERMRIDSSGNVGIGTSSPRSKADVAGTLTVGDANPPAVKLYRNVALGSSSSAGLLDFGGRYDATNYATGAQIAALTPSVWSSTNYGASLLFSTVASGSTTLTERMRIDSSGNVGIGTSSPATLGSNITTVTVNGTSGGGIQFQRTDATAVTGLVAALSGSFALGSITSTDVTFRTGNTERARIDSSGNLLVGKTTSGTSVGAGVEASANGSLFATRNLSTAGSDAVAFLNRETTFGDIIRFRKDGTTIGVIGCASASTVYVGSGDTTITFSPSGDAIVPSGTDGATRSGVINLGNSSNRWDTVYAAVGTINTSDRTEKQDIEELNDAERRVAVACKGLLRKYRLKSAVALKGEDARIHFGIIAQDLQAAFAAEGLDAGRYGMFIHSTWTDEETGEEKSLMGVRYSELLAFMVAVL